MQGHRHWQTQWGFPLSHDRFRKNVQIQLFLGISHLQECLSNSDSSDCIGDVGPTSDVYVGPTSPGDVFVGPAADGGVDEQLYGDDDAFGSPIDVDPIVPDPLGVFGSPFYVGPAVDVEGDVDGGSDSPVEVGHVDGGPLDDVGPILEYVGPHGMV